MSAKSKTLLDSDFDGGCLEEMVQSITNEEDEDTFLKRMEKLEFDANETKDILIHVKKWVEKKLVIRIKNPIAIGMSDEEKTSPSDIEAFIIQFLSKIGVTELKLADEGVYNSYSVIINGFGSDFKFIGRHDSIQNITNIHWAYMKEINEKKQLAEKM